MTQQNHPRQLLIGLDAMEWTLVTQWAQAGKLPNFRRLLEQGMSGPLATTAAQLPDTVWPSLYTGTNPAKFEKYFYVQYDPDTMGLKHVPDDANQRTPFWEYLSQAGRRVGVMDAPKVKLSAAINGFQLANWGAHATKTARASAPTNLLSEVNARLGRHPVGDCDMVDAKPKAIRALRQRVLDGVRAHGQLFRWQMKEQSWDVFFGAFSAPHCIGHHFWHGVDASHPHHHELAQEGLADTVEQVYRAIDREMGEMLELIDANTHVTVFAAHGMGSLYHASWSLPEMLDLLGYSTHQPRQINNTRPREAQINPWRWLKMVVPGRVQYAIKNQLPQTMQDWLLFRWYAGGRDWKGCRAFAVPNNDIVGSIRISVKGRDRYGMVEPGEEYHRVCHEIAAALYELTDPVSGRPVVKQVTFLHEVFDGPFLPQLPDLTVLWDQSFAWDTLSSPRVGTLHIKQQDGRTGSHSAHGFAILTGPGIPAGMPMTGGSIYDLAPTVLETAHVPVPPDLDGQSLLAKREPVLV